MQNGGDGDDDGDGDEEEEEEEDYLRREKGSHGNEDRRKLYVGGLGFGGAPKEFLRRYFERFGAVENAYIPRFRDTGKYRGFAFVLMEEEEGFIPLILLSFYPLLSLVASFTLVTSCFFQIFKSPPLYPNPFYLILPYSILSYPILLFLLSLFFFPLHNIFFPPPAFSFLLLLLFSSLHFTYDLFSSSSHIFFFLCPP